MMEPRFDCIKSIALCLPSPKLKKMVMISLLLATMILMMHSSALISISLRRDAETVHEPATILTLFTTFKPTLKKEVVYMNTLRNWALFSDRARLILYTDTSSSDLPSRRIIQAAKDSGWLIRDVPVSTHDLPVLKHMFMDARNISDTAFYGFANSDILFTSLIESILAVNNTRLPAVFCIGQRTNVRRNWRDTFHIADVLEAASNGTLFSTYAQDYFITARDRFPWKHIPPFVVGRGGYDNWLVAYSMIRDIPVVDFTRTVLAVHQTDHRGNFEGHNQTRHKNFNKDMVPKDFNYNLGLTGCSHLITSLQNEKVVVQIRLKNPCVGRYNAAKKLLYKKTIQLDYEWMNVGLL